MRFTHEDNFFQDGFSKKWLYKLGVWNKNYGFKIINTPDIENLASAFTTKKYLFVKGAHADGTLYKISIIPISEGYWGSASNQNQSKKSLGGIKLNRRGGPNQDV